MFLSNPKLVPIWPNVVSKSQEQVPFWPSNKVNFVLNLFLFMKYYSCIFQYVPFFINLLLYDKVFFLKVRNMFHFGLNVFLNIWNMFL